MIEDTPVLDVDTGQQPGEQVNPTVLTSPEAQPQAESIIIPEAPATDEQGTEKRGEGEEGRWDYDKARTMADVLEKGSGKIIIDEAARSHEASAEKGEESVESETKEAVNILLSPFEEVYDLNPDHFANMPTHEFMDIVAGLQKIDAEIHRHDLDLKLISRQKEQIQEFIELKQLIEVHEANDLKRNYRNWLHKAKVDPQTIDQKVEEINKVIQDKFDLSPRQKMETYLGAVREAEVAFKRLSEEPKRQRQEFLDKYKPQNASANEHQAENQPEEQLEPVAA